MFTGSRTRKAASTLVLPWVLTMLALPVLDGCQGEAPKVAGIKQKVAGSGGKVTQESPRPGTGETGTKEPPAGDLLPLEVAVSGGIEDRFSPRSTRDPFRSFIELRDRVRREPQTFQLLTPLQKYSLDQLKVVGVVGALNVRSALLEDDVGKGYVVNAGDYVGNQGGRIAAIASDHIVIEESFQDLLGETKVRRITKRLHPTDAGNP